MPQLDPFLTTSNFSDKLKSIMADAPMPSLDDSLHCDKTAEAVEQYLIENNLQCSLSAAGLWLLAGDLDRSHTISQSYHSGDGAYWHGLMHRREGDYWNSKYWFQKAADHPIREQLSERIHTCREQLSEHNLPLDQLVEHSRVSESLSDLVSQSVDSGPAWSSELQLVCWLEWQLLMVHCCESN